MYKICESEFPNCGHPGKKNGSSPGLGPLGIFKPILSPVATKLLAFMATVVVKLFFTVTMELSKVDGNNTS